MICFLWIIFPSFASMVSFHEIGESMGTNSYMQDYFPSIFFLIVELINDEWFIVFRMFRLWQGGPEVQRYFQSLFIYMISRLRRSVQKMHEDCFPVHTITHEIIPFWVVACKAFNLFSLFTQVVKAAGGMMTGGMAGNAAGRGILNGQLPQVNIKA